MQDPLKYLDRKDLLNTILRNIESKIKEDCRVEKYDSQGNIELKFWFDNTPNWAKIQRFITYNTSKSGSTSAYQMCSFLGINPNEYSFYKNET
jgi:hypothetical protein